jgi:peptidoglycan/LPS O-acetylase OafA/YrhL
MGSYEMPQNRLAGDTHYFGLDALRGVAALMVVVFHAEDDFAGLLGLRWPRLSEPFFFASISGGSAGVRLPNGVAAR